jgi:homoserine O-succinyltransferase
LCFCKGHPEYDRISLLKEYKREVTRFIEGERSEYPPHPENYFSREAAAIADRYHGIVLSVLNSMGILSHHFRKKRSKSFWIIPGVIPGKVFSTTGWDWFTSLTNVDRKIPFMPGIDPEDPHWGCEIMRLLPRRL